MALMPEVNEYLKMIGISQQPLLTTFHSVIVICYILHMASDIISPLTFLDATL